jgi:hypothetical protein
VPFGIGRAIGTLANLVWDRGLGYPIGRPKSVTTAMLEKAAGIKWPGSTGKQLGLDCVDSVKSRVVVTLDGEGERTAVFDVRKDIVQITGFAARDSRRAGPGPAKCQKTLTVKTAKRYIGKTSEHSYT